MCWNNCFDLLEHIIDLLEHNKTHTIKYLFLEILGFIMGIFDFLKRKKKKRVGTVPTQAKYPVVEPLPTKDLLKEWLKTVEMVENHPLSQVRVINTAILSELTRVLNSMNEKLEKLNKLNKIADMLEEVRSQIKDAGISTKNIDNIISTIKGLTIKDREYLDLFEEGEELTTEEFAKRAKLSRSTASSRLNKLFSMGLLEKKAQGKKIVFTRKKFDN